MEGFLLIKKFCTVGQAHSGKMSWSFISRGNIPARNMTSTSPDSGLFALSMIDSDTQLFIFDEWSEEKLSTNMKALLGGSSLSGSYPMCLLELVIFFLKLIRNHYLSTGGDCMQIQGTSSAWK